MVGMLGSVMSAAGSIEAGQAQQNVDLTNAANERTAANSEEATAAANATQIQSRTSRIVGQASANAAASGVSGGSPLAVMHDIATQGELSRQLTLYQGRNRARNLLGQASIDVGEGQQAAQAGEIQAGSTILTAGSTFGQQNYPGTMAMLNNPMSW